MITFNYSVRTILRKHANVYTISFVVRWNKKKNELWISSGYQWLPEKWDNEKQQARNNTTIKNSDGKTVYARDVNSMRLFYLEQIDKAFTEFMEHDLIPTKEDLRERFNELVGNVDKMPAVEAAKFTDTHKFFQDIYEEFMRERAIEKNWSKSTRDKNAQMWTCLCDFNPNITLGKLNRSTLNKLKQWYYDHGYHNTTISKRFRDLKSFLRWIADKGYPINDEALRCKIDVITYLVFDELMTFANHPFKQAYLENARDIFCFMCYTSLRYSDVRNLKKAHINGAVIELFTQKTKEKLEIPVIVYAKALIDKYKNTDGENLFNVPSNQKLNDYIKVAAKEAGLDRMIGEMYYVGNDRHETFKPIHEIITCHLARRTFVTCSLALGIPPEVVMKCTGHSSYEAMKPYIDIASSTTQEQMEKWNINSIKHIVQKKVDSLTTEQLEQLNQFLDELLQITPE